ncbi:hypothetical protein C4J81_19115 (plasmid) [Deltaproteobacteria bacterium Smac51]|nr:hypothetical protein C4J81_19115 [Deltaproteobacteria bacterium Smac51]
MPEVPSFNKLVMAISRSVLEAQEKIEAAQLANLMSYFRRKPGRKGFFPIAMKVNLPSLRPEAPAGSTDSYQVPYLSVVPYSSLRIKQMDVDFDVSFNALNVETDGGDGDEGPPETADEAGQPSDSLPNLAIDLGGTRKSGSFMAHVHLSLEGVDMPDGAARLINELIKTNQVYETSLPPEGEEPEPGGPEGPGPNGDEPGGGGDEPRRSRRRRR